MITPSERRPAHPVSDPFAHDVAGGHLLVGHGHSIQVAYGDLERHAGDCSPRSILFECPTPRASGGISGASSTHLCRRARHCRVVCSLTIPEIVSTTGESASRTSSPSPSKRSSAITKAVRRRARRGRLQQHSPDALERHGVAGKPPDGVKARGLWEYPFER